MTNQEELKQMLKEMLTDGAPIEVHKIGLLASIATSLAAIADSTEKTVKNRKMSDQTMKDIDRAFKALDERNELLDKIENDIKQLDTDYCGGYTGLDMAEVLHIIGKYKGGADNGEEKDPTS